MAGNKLARRIILKCLPFAIITSLTSTVTYYNNMMIASVTIGQEAVQAISSESLYTLFLSVIASMLATGGAVAFIGYRYRRKPNEASESFTLSLLSGTVFGFVFMVVCQLMTPIGVEQDAVTLADEYIRAIGLSAIPVFLLQIVNAHLWVDEDCKEAASVVTLDDSKDIADISEGTVHTNIVGLNIYSATFPL